MAENLDEEDIEILSKTRLRCQESSQRANSYHPIWYEIRNEDDLVHSVPLYTDTHERMVNLFKTILLLMAEFCNICIVKISAVGEEQEVKQNEINTLFEQYFTSVVDYYAHTIRNRTDPSTITLVGDVEKLQVCINMFLMPDLIPVDKMKDVNRYILLITSCSSPSNIDETSRNLESELHRECRKKRPVHVRLLVESGVNVNGRELETGFTPLHALCYINNFLDDKDNEVEIAEILIGGGCNANVTDYYNRTCLFLLKDVYGYRGELFQYLTEHIDITKEDQFDRTALFYYSNLCYSINQTTELSKEDIELIHKKDMFGLTALHVFIHHCFRNGERVHPSVEFWIYRLCRTISTRVVGVIVRSKLGVTPLHLAVMIEKKEHMVEVVRTLLENGADPNVADNFQSTPLHYAIYARSDPELVQLMIENGVDLDIRDSMLRNASDLAEELCFHEFRTLLDGNCFLHNIQRRTPADIPENTLNTAVESLIRNLMRRVAELDSRFENCEIRLSGSVCERTKTGLPDEFDFQLYMTDLGRFCHAVCYENGEAKLYLSGNLVNVNKKYRNFFDSDYKLTYMRLKEIFRGLVEEALHDHEMWEGTNFVYFPMERSKFTGPALCLEIMLHGGDIKCLQISVDLVLTIPIHSRKVELVGNIPAETVNVIKNRNRACFVLLAECARLSMSEVEANIMKKIPFHIKEGYRKSKAIRSDFIRKSLTYRTRQNSHQASKVISTYVLKCSFFYVLKQHGILTFDTNGEIIITSAENSGGDSDFWCREIFSYLIDHIDRNDYFPTFFFPRNKSQVNRDLDRLIRHVLEEESPPEERMRSVTPTPDEVPCSHLAQIERSRKRCCIS